MDKKAIEALRQETKTRQRRTTDLARFEPTLKEMMDADISLPVILTWLKPQQETTLPALRRYIRRVFGEEFYDNFLMRNGWHRTKQEGRKTVPARQAATLDTPKKPISKPASTVAESQRADKGVGVSVDRVKEITQGRFDPNQFNDDE